MLRVRGRREGWIEAICMDEKGVGDGRGYAKVDDGVRGGRGSAKGLEQLLIQDSAATMIVCRRRRKPFFET